MSKVAVIGGGAAGLMAAGYAAMYGADVTVFEKMPRVGRKILISGKGRCNLTNACDISAFMSNVPVNNKFLYSAINNFPPYDIIDFFENLGLRTKVERGNRVFPVSDKAMDVVDIMRKFVLDNGAEIINAEAEDVIAENSQVKAVRANGKLYDFDSVIITTGGLSYPRTGSTGDGFRFAKKLGHTVIPAKPSLVPLVSPDKDCGAMQGLSLKNVGLKITDKDGKTVYSDFGEMLFTHFGISGPMVLSASCNMNDYSRGYTAHIDLKPALSEEQLDLRIQRDFKDNINKAVSNSLSKLLPRKMIPVVLRRWGIDTDKKCNSVTREERGSLLKILKDFTVKITRPRSIDEAIITSGGVKVSEINPKTMESKLVKGLYFAGEVIDVDAYTGGFNLTIAWATGRLAGESTAFNS
ncbi:MAG: NAD(P)/FAD-dependent oxidoreductase [Ruminococcus sp.]|nr:NAD(P)/FAD-dependent oxidoreductase [Ruminococcus sp.]